MLGVSSNRCLSSVVRKGSDEATKSTSRLGSSMLAAIVRSSSESVCDSLTICWNWLITLRTSASALDVAACSVSSRTSTSATMKGSVCVKRTSRTRSVPSVKTKRLWLGMRTTLCTVASVPTTCRSAGLGASWRGSN